MLIDSGELCFPNFHPLLPALLAHTYTPLSSRRSCFLQECGPQTCPRLSCSSTDRHTTTLFLSLSVTDLLRCLCCFCYSGSRGKSIAPPRRRSSYAASLLLLYRFSFRLVIRESFSALRIASSPASLVGCRHTDESPVCSYCWMHVL